MQQPGTLIEGKYEILGKIREGGMGTIYKVRHRLLDEIRVIKVLKPETLSSEEMRRRFVEEARTATRLKHVNIGTIHDFSVDEEGKAYLVMEFIDGINIADLLQAQGPPGLGLSLEIGHQALSALAYLHRKNVVHRDIAPDNLMLTYDEEGRPLIKLIDLGIAKTLDQAGGGMTSTGVFLGKLKYASPEQFGALPTGEKLDGRSDLYSMGVVLYELLTGVYPFAGQSPTELLRAHLFEHPIPFEQTDRDGKVPPEARAMVLKALEKRREERFTSAEEFDSEVVAVSRSQAQPRELDETVQIILKVRAMPPRRPNPTVTPSLQDRLDRQFVAASTPPPTRAILHPVENADKTEVISDDDVAKTEVIPTAAPIAPAVAAGRQLLQPLQSRRSWVLAAAAVAILASIGFFLRSGVLQHAAPSPVRTAVPTLAARPSVPTLAPLPETPQVRQPAEATAAPTPVVVPTVGPEEPRLLREQAGKARSRLIAAQRRAERAGAPERAAELYALGRSKEKEGQEDVARGEFEAAGVAFDVGRDAFLNAEKWTRAHPAARPSPSQQVNASSEVRAGLQPTAAPVPATAAPAPVHTSVALPIAPQVQRGGSRASDEEKIREMVRRYEKAQSTLDPDLYVRVYPSVDIARVRQAFDQLRSQTLELEIRKIEIAPGGSTAVVRGFERRVAVPRVGSEQHFSGDRVLLLEQRGGSWVITRLGS